MVRWPAETDQIPYQSIKSTFTFIAPLGLPPNDSRTC